MTNMRKLLAVLGVLVLSFAGWYVWKTVTTHGQGHVESHEHEHAHGEGVDHGHEHDGPTDVTHSHSHQHDRHHHGAIEPPQPGLTEIGHSHDRSGTTHFWAKLAAGNDGEFVLEFFASGESELKTAAPSSSRLNAQILNGSKAEEEANFEKLGDNFVARLPDDFLVLPTHIFKFQALEFGDLKVDAFLSVKK